ncbi:MAG: diaminopimelate decarboxylase [Candidatus Omnitrophota bacterium]
MHEFKMKHNELYCESVKVSEIARAVGTPLYVYSNKTMLGHFNKLRRAFSPVKPLICFSVKSNSNIAVLRSMVKNGSGLDIVSGGELYRSRLAGVRPEKIVYAGVGKRAKEIIEAIKLGILFFNVESEEELDGIQNAALKLDKKVNVAIRINPNVMPKTHDYISTGKDDSKFGLDFETVHKIFNLRWKYPNCMINGVHIHIGSQIMSVRPFQNAINSVLSFLTKNSIKIEYLNIGGGLGIMYSSERPQTAQEFAVKIIPLLKKSRLKIILEPGRFIAGNSGILVTTVLYTKRTPRKKFVIVDSGMNDLIRPSLYGSYHRIVPVARPTRNGQYSEKVDVVGPICESGDFLAKERVLTRVAPGDILAVMTAGAYGFAMSSNYNSRPRAAEVLVSGNKYDVIRRRETYKDLIRGEKIPAYLLR